MAAVTVARSIAPSVSLVSGPFAEATSLPTVIQCAWVGGVLGSGRQAIHPKTPKDGEGRVRRERATGPQ